MSIQSDAAQKHIVGLLNAAYPNTPMNAAVMKDNSPIWYGEYYFTSKCPMIAGYRNKNNKMCKNCIGKCNHHAWRFDYAVPALLCAKPHFITSFELSHSGAHYRVGRWYIPAGQNRSCIWRGSQELAREAQRSYEPRVESMALCT